MPINGNRKGPSKNIWVWEKCHFCTRTRAELTAPAAASTGVISCYKHATLVISYNRKLLFSFSSSICQPRSLLNVIVSFLRGGGLVGGWVKIWERERGGEGGREGGREGVGENKIMNLNKLLNSELSCASVYHLVRSEQNNLGGRRSLAIFMASIAT